MGLDPLQSMWVSFIGLGLMFVSVVLAIISREKLNGIFRFIGLAFSFICLSVAGIIVLLIVLQGPTAEAFTG
ncbi:DUF2768 domain-containing protein [Salsuginibacillus kocurii]|uniref:DUF2768 domain-containing protein n=1 Tax=Salsuginibacillus kocurii TaxID=427078 RepID=UPI00036B04FD|nr:DUF2768 domain-containing protein [Salsuginibacillus kocurii]